MRGVAGLALLALAVAGCSGSGGSSAAAGGSLPPIVTPSASASSPSTPSAGPTSAAPTASATASATLSPPAPRSTPARGSAYDTVTAYFDAINRKDWPSVWALGGKNVNSSYSSMVDGYAHTAHDDVVVYGGAGSEVRVAVLARADSGITALYAGGYSVEAGVITRGVLTLQTTLHDSPAAIGGFAADWEGHGRGISIAADGIGVLTYRTYAACGDSPSAPCDAVVGNEIVDGGLTVFQITSVSGDTATATDLFTTAPSRPPLTLRLQPAAGTLTISTFDVPFCDPAAEDKGVCGA